MPNYEYKCTQDSSTFEIWQEVGSAAPPCPECGAPTKKVFHPTRTIFKGSGFYVTDLRAEKSAASSASKPSSTPVETKTEDKAPATTESTPAPAAAAAAPGPATSAPAAPVAPAASK